MKIRVLFLAICAGVLSSSSWAWTTMDTVTGSAVVQSTVAGLGCSLTGTALATGSAMDTHGRELWITRASLDSGRSWKTVDPFGTDPSNPYRAFPTRSTAVAVRTDGTLWVSVGYAQTSLQGCVGITRMSLGVNRAWTTIDTIRPTAKSPCYRPTGVALGKNGEIWVVGTENPGRMSAFLVLRRSLDFGATWKTVLQYRHRSKLPTEATAVSVHPDTGAVLVSGLAAGVGFNLFARTPEFREVGVIDEFQGSTPDGLAYYRGYLSPDGLIYSVGCAWAPETKTRAFTRVFSPSDKQWKLLSEGPDGSCTNAITQIGHAVLTTGERDRSWVTDLSLDLGLHFNPSDQTKPVAKGQGVCIWPTGGLMAAGNATSMSGNTWGIRIGTP